MAHRITCLIPTCKNTCGRNNTKTTFLEIFFIGYNFITARKVSSAISSLNVCEKAFEKSCNIDISLPEQPEFNARKWNIAYQRPKTTIVTKMAEQTNLYAVRRSFKPVSDRVIYLYLYINILTGSGKRLFPM